MRIFTLGNGFVSDHLSYQKITTRVDASSKLIENLLDTHKPDVLINCIGKTGRPNVDWCEINKEITAATNVALPIILAEECAKKSIHLIQIGSGCCFFGESPHFSESEHKDYGWKEADVANPKSFYSKTKYSCDLAIGDMKNVTTLRIRMPISNKNNPRNLINKLRGYKQVINIPNSMTFMSDLEKCIAWIVSKSLIGIFHVTNPEPLTAVEIMEEYKKYVPDHSFEIIDEKQLDNLTLAKRSNCIIDSGKLKEKGFSMSPSKEALKKCMAQYIKNI